MNRNGFKNVKICRSKKYMANVGSVSSKEPDKVTHIRALLKHCRRKLPFINAYNRMHFLKPQFKIL